MERQNWKKIAQTLMEEFRDRDFSGLVERDVHIPKDHDKILVFIGMRRVGKTSCLYKQIDELLKSGVSRERIFYVNFEDERLLPMDAKGLGHLVETWQEENLECTEEICHYFFDEIQNVSDWAVFIRRLHDNKKNKIWITGSSAKLLSNEIATSLRGRSISVAVWPLSFLEFCSFRRGKEFPKNLTLTDKRHALNLVRDYVAYGGFPEIVMHDRSKTAWPILQEYLQTVIYRDVVDRHHLSNTTLLNYLLKTLVNNVANSFSANKFFHDAKSQGFAVSKNTVHEYLGYLNDALCVFTLSIHSSSIRVRNSNPRKTYLIDAGLARANSLKYQNDFGHLFENIVFMELFRRGYRLSFFKGPNDEEVDFIAEDDQGKKHAYQACWDVSNENTLEREVRSLSVCEQSLKIKGSMVTPKDFIAFVQSLKTNTRGKPFGE